MVSKVEDFQTATLNIVDYLQENCVYLIFKKMIQKTNKYHMSKIKRSKAISASTCKPTRFHSKNES